MRALFFLLFLLNACFLVGSIIDGNALAAVVNTLGVVFCAWAYIEETAR